MIKQGLLFVVLALLLGCTQKHYYFVSEGSLSRYVQGEESSYVSDRDEEVNLLLGGHYVGDGDSLILLLRMFDGGSVVAVDDETFEKLTIEIRKEKAHVGVPILINSADVRFYYSRGVSGYIYRAHGVYSSVGSGQITILDIGKDYMTVNIDMTVNVKPARVSVALEEEVVGKHGNYQFRKISTKELTPWLGIPDQNYGKEVYP